MPTVTVDYETEGDSSFVEIDDKRMPCTGTEKKGTCKKNVPPGKHKIVFGTSGPPGSDYNCTIEGAKPKPKAIEGTIGNAMQALRKRTITVPSDGDES